MIATHGPEADVATHGTADRCRARTSSGRPCRAHPIRGGTVCVAHGGAAPQVRQAAERRLEVRRVEVEAARLMGSAGEDRHPLEHLLLELYRSAAVVQVLGDELDDVAIVDDRGPSIVYRLWCEERDRHARIADLALRAGVQERAVRLAEAQAQLIVGAVRAALAELNVDPDDDRTRRVLRRHLTALSAGGATDVA
jgi:hypothetical protein